MTQALWQLFFAGVFFLLSMVFAATETALLSLSRPRLKKLISQRPALATAFTEWLRSPQYLMTTILIGNVLSNVMATLLTTEAAIVLFPHWRHAWVDAGAWLVMSLLIFVWGDFIPKSFARHYPQAIALATLPRVSALARVLTPAIRWFLGILERLFPGMQGVPVGRLSVYSVEELREMIRTGAAEGGVPRRSGQMMERVLSLNRLPVSKIMTPWEKVDAIDLGLNQDRVLDQVAEAGRTRLPAYRVNVRRVAGFLHVKDLLLAWRGLLPLNLDILLRQPLKVPPDFPAGELLEEFRKGVAHLAIVMDADGQYRGIVTLEDVLEEIVGEILDEYDLENPRGIR
jgi:putative hemolysin